MATFNPQTFLKQIGSGKTTLKIPKKQVLFSQGDTTDAVFYVQAGKVMLSVISPQGKEAVIVILELGSFFVEGCAAAAGQNQPSPSASAAVANGVPSTTASAPHAMALARSPEVWMSPSASTCT